jgi:hypothetical protein
VILNGARQRKETTSEAESRTSQKEGSAINTAKKKCIIGIKILPYSKINEGVKPEPKLKNSCPQPAASAAGCEGRKTRRTDFSRQWRVSLTSFRTVLNNLQLPYLLIRLITKFFILNY